MSHSGPTQARVSTVHQRLRALYDQLWSQARGRIRAGRIEGDPVLQAQVPDRRRGLTLIARPSLAVQRSVSRFLRGLRRLEPDQYYYSSSEFHVTILSLFTATVDFEPFLKKKESYLAAVKSALQEPEPIRISFEGITASASAVMVQGFFDNNSLSDMRDRLRSELGKQGLAKGVDQRYRLQTAHMTVIRFRAPLRRPEQFARALEQARGRVFSAMTVRRFILVENDWYMSRRATVSLKRYPG